MTRAITDIGDIPQQKPLAASQGVAAKPPAVINQGIGRPPPIGPPPPIGAPPPIGPPAPPPGRWTFVQSILLGSSTPCCFMIAWTRGSSFILLMTSGSFNIDGSNAGRVPPGPPGPPAVAP